MYSPDHTSDTEPDISSKTLTSTTESEGFISSATQSSKHSSHDKFTPRERALLTSFEKGWNDVENFPHVTMTSKQREWFNSLGNQKTYSQEYYENRKGIKNLRKRRRKRALEFDNENERRRSDYNR